MSSIGRKVVKISMKRLISLFLALVLLCSTCLLTACGGGADPTTPPQTTPSDPTPGDPAPAETVSLDATQRVVYAPAVSFSDPSYNAYYMEATAVLEFRDRLADTLGFHMVAKGSSTPVTQTGIDARVDPSMHQNEWDISVGADKIIYVRAGHYASLEAGLNALYQKVKATENKIPVDYTASGNVFATTSKVNSIFGNYGATGNYQLVWNDEFYAFNDDRWSYSDENPVKAGVTRENIAYVEDGKLIIPAYKTADEAVFHTSQLVTTFDTMNFNGGYLEMRAKIPFQDIGEWVSLWATTGRAILFARDWWREGNTGHLEYDMENQHGDGFGVEVDIFEVFSSTNSLSPNIWFWKNGGRDSQLSAHGQGTHSYTFIKDPNEYHLYSFYWNDEWMIFAIDGTPYMAVSMTESVMGNTKYYSKGRSALSLRLQNDVFTPQYCQSNGWANSNKADGDASYQSDFVIDYIRLYQCEEDILYLPETVGEGTMTFDKAKLNSSYWTD